MKVFLERSAETGSIPSSEPGAGVRGFRCPSTLLRSLSAGSHTERPGWVCGLFLWMKRRYRWETPCFSGTITARDCFFFNISGFVQKPRGRRFISCRISVPFCLEAEAADAAAHGEATPTEESVIRFSITGFISPSSIISHRTGIIPPLHSGLLNWHFLFYYSSQ